MNTTIPEILDAAAAAAYLCIAKSTLAKLRLSGDGPIFIKIGRRVLYRLSDLDAYLDTCRRTSTSDSVNADVAEDMDV